LEHILRVYVRMKTASMRLREMIEDDSGAVATEYALLLVFVALAIIAGATALGIAINNRLNESATTIGP
jgi:Flp pilus assembly pilin Flp